jgi:hypothetical protein
MGPQDLPLGLLIAARDAARMALGGVHLIPSLLEGVTVLSSCRGAVNRPAFCSLAVRSHRSSIRSKLAFSPAYHLTTA